MSKHLRGQLLRMAAIAMLLGVTSNQLFACLWDSDTLAQERSRFPSTLELITGKFLRHSRPFYVWRAAQNAANDGLLSAEEYDNLAVALEKMGRTDAAIETILKKDELYPDRYETYANLGTFLIHAGRYEEGIKSIEKAISINDDAHFGREKYQLLLVRYLLKQQASDRKETSDSPPVPMTRGFARFVIEHATAEAESRSETFDQDAEIQAALKGVQGMMRFGNYDSPILLEALGDLLSTESPKNAMRLASRAYLRAADESEGEEAKTRLQSLAANCLKLHEGVKLSHIRERLDAEMEEAKEWHAALKERELQWVKDPNVDPEAEFLKLYQVEDDEAVSRALAVTASPFANVGARKFVAVAIALLLAILVAVALLIRSRVPNESRV